MLARCRSSILSRFFQPKFMSSLVNENSKPKLIDVGDPSMPDKLYKTIELEIRSSETAVMKSYSYFLQTAARHLGIEIGKVWSRKKSKNERYTLLKSIFIYRKHLVQYEIRTYFHWIRLHKLTGSTADTYIEYIQRMLPEGVALKVTKVSIEPLPSHLKPESVALDSTDQKTS